MVPPRAPVYFMSLVNWYWFMDESLPDDDSKIEKVRRERTLPYYDGIRVSNPELISRVVDFLYDELVGLL